MPALAAADSSAPELEPDPTPTELAVGPGPVPAPAPRWRWAWTGPAALGVGVALATAFVAVHDPHRPGSYPECASRSLLGLDCPACGGLRAVSSLTQGDLAAAADHNLLAVVALPLLALAWGLWMAGSLGVVLPAGPRPSRRSWVGIGVSIGALVVAFTVARNLGGPALFTYLGSDA